MPQDVSVSAAAPRWLAWLDGRLKLWHVLATLAATVVSTAALRIEAMGTMRGLVADPAYFQTNPLLFDGRTSGYTAAEATRHLAALGALARDYYAATYYPQYDLLFPLCLLAFGVALILYATRPGAAWALQVPSAVRIAALALPVLLFAVDMMENWGVLTMLDAFPRLQPGELLGRQLVETASLMTRLKWLLAHLSTAVGVGLVLYCGLAWWRSRARASGAGAAGTPAT